MNVSPMEDIPLQRIVRLAVVEEIRYWRPEHVVLLGEAEIPAGEALATCICWLFGKRPYFMRMIDVASPLKEKAEEIAVKSNTDQYLVFIAMAGLMTLGKELRVEQDGNEEYLAKRWQALCATICIDDEISRDIGKFTASFLRWQKWIKPRPMLRKK